MGSDSRMAYIRHLRRLLQGSDLQNWIQFPVLRMAASGMALAAQRKARN